MKKLNIAEILKDCPKGMELDCTIFEDVTFEKVIDASYPIKIITNDSAEFLTEYGCVSYIDSAKCVIFPKGKTTWEGFQKPFKDGDVAVTDKGHIHLLRTKDSSYCAYRGDRQGLPKFDSTITTGVKVIRFATEEEKQKLFDVIKENGYKWNTETKTLEKLIVPKFKVGDRIRHKITNKNDIYEISKVYDDSYGLVDFTWMVYMKYQDDYELVPNKFDITTLKPFDKVLVRNTNGQVWTADLFSHMLNTNHYLSITFVCLGHCPNQCIPFEGNEHLLGTTNDCDDYYKTWK